MRRFPAFPLAPFALSLLMMPLAGADDQYWAPSPPTGTWDDVSLHWAPLPATAASAPWVDGNTAWFDRAGVYTVTLDGLRTASALIVTSGEVTLEGSTLDAQSVEVSAGATLTASVASYLRTGTTNLKIDGSLYHSGGPAAGQIVTLNGAGYVNLAGDMRIGPGNFSGIIEGTGGFLTQAAGTIVFAGTNTYSGVTLLRNSNILRLESPGALSANSFLRFGGGVNVLELAAGNFSRQVGAGTGLVRVNSNADGAGTTGFSAIGEDRLLILDGQIAGTPVLWQTASNSSTFSPTALQFGNINATHKVTLTSPIDLNGSTRTISTANGVAEIEGEISGVISNSAATPAGLTKSGPGTLLLSNNNTYDGVTLIAGTSGPINALRLSSAGAAGTGSLTIGSGGNSDAARLELTGGITFTNPLNAVTSRNSDAPNIVNVSGDNIVTSNLSAGAGGSRTSLKSDSGLLIMNGNLSVRALNLQGSGDGEIKGNLTLAATNPLGLNYLNKSGTGRWTVAAGTCNSNAINVVDGTLALSAATSLAGAGLIRVDSPGRLDLTPAGGWTLGATQELRGTEGTVEGNLTVDGTISPGGPESVSKVDFTNNLTLQNPSILVIGIAPDGLSNDKLTIAGTLVAGGTVIVELAADSSFTPTVGNEFDIADAALITGTPAITGTLPAGLQWDATGFATSGKIRIIAASTAPYDLWATANGLTGINAFKNSDPDKDGATNLVEFALNGNPTDSSNAGLSTIQAADLTAPAGPELNLTLAVRAGAVFTPGAHGTQTSTVDGLTYTVAGSLNLTSFTGPVTFVSSSPTAPGLTDLAGTDWRYATFKLQSSEGLPGKGFLRVSVAPAAP